MDMNNVVRIGDRVTDKNEGMAMVEGVKLVVKCLQEAGSTHGNNSKGLSTNDVITACVEIIEHIAEAYGLD